MVDADAGLAIAAGRESRAELGGGGSVCGDGDVGRGGAGVVEEGLGQRDREPVAGHAVLGDAAVAQVAEFGDAWAGGGKGLHKFTPYLSYATLFCAMQHPRMPFGGVCELVMKLWASWHRKEVLAKLWIACGLERSGYSVCLRA